MVLPSKHLVLAPALAGALLGGPTEALLVSMDGVAGLARCGATVRAHRTVPIDVKLRVITVAQVSSRRCTLAIQNANGNDRG
jgi:hypothetical protein